MIRFNGQNQQDNFGHVIDWTNQHNFTKINKFLSKIWIGEESSIYPHNSTFISQNYRLSLNLGIPDSLLN